jgi:preprotein translocase subunit YajC
MAYAAGGAGGVGGKPQDIYSTLLLFAIMGLIFYFFLIRPQSKRQKEHQKVLDELKRGDEIVTTGGIIGKIHSITDKVVVLEIAQNVRIRLVKGQIAGRYAAEAAAAPAKEE